MKILSGDFLFMEGEKNTAIYIVQSGSLSAIQKRGTLVKIVETFGPGSIIGQLPSEESYLYPYSVKAEEDSSVEKITDKEIITTLSKTPIWFSKFVGFLQKRHLVLLQKNQKKQAILALPALLSVLDHFFRTTNLTKISFNDIITALEPLTSIKAEIISNLCKALSAIGFFKYNNCSIELTHPAVPSLLHMVFTEKILEDKIPSLILSATDQILLETFAKAAQQNGTLLENRFIEISGLAFSQEAPVYLKKDRKIFNSLIEKKIIRLESANSGLFNEDKIYGDLEHISDLLELNRIYPLLDHELAKHL